uniref:Glycos_transf_1 domain-containing protein n=1 Tax=Panagrellus redivivus TaxID=6233 RepID=A0A7E4V5J7_PANRE
MSSEAAVAVFTQDPGSPFQAFYKRRKSTSSYEASGHVLTSGIDSSAKAFARKVPPSTVQAVYILNQVGNDPTNFKLIEPALKSAGFKNVCTISQDSYQASVSLDAVNLDCAVGELVGLLATSQYLQLATVVEKTSTGYKFVKSFADFPNELKEFPSLKHVILLDDATDAVKAEFAKLYRGKQLHYASIDLCRALWKYVWNKFDNGNFGGNFLEEVISFDTLLKFKDGMIYLPFRGEAMPMVTTFQLDIAHAAKVDVYVQYCGIPPFTPVKTFNFKTKKDRIIKVTVSVGFDQVPNISLETTSPVVAIAPIPLVHGKVGINIQRLPSYQYTVISQTSITPSTVFPSIEALVGDLRREVPSKDVHFILYECEATQNDAAIADAFKCVNLLHTSSYPTVNLSNSFNPLASMMFFGYDIAVAEDECIAVLTDFVAILQRKKRSFHLLHTPGVYAQLKEYLDKYDVKTIINTFSKDEPHATNFRGRNVILSNREAVLKRYNNCYLQNYLNGGDFNGCIIDNPTNIEFFVSWNDTTVVYRTGYVTAPYTWTVELDAENARELKVIPHCGVAVNAEDSDKRYSLKQLGPKVALTFNIKTEFGAHVTCDALAPGCVPRAISLCLLVERTAKGFRKTLYFRDSDKTIVDECPNLFVALEPFKQAEYTVIVFNASDTTAAERKTWQQMATGYGFKAIQFVNGPVLLISSALFYVDPKEYGENKTVLVSDMTAVDKSGQKTPMTYVLRSHQKMLQLQKALPAKIDKVFGTFDSVELVVAVVEDASKSPMLPIHLNAAVLQVCHKTASDYLFSRIDTDAVIEPLIRDVTGITFVAEWKGSNQVFHTEFETLPFSRDVAIHVGEVKSLRIKTTHPNSKQRELLKEFSFKTPYDRVVMLNIAVDSMLVPSVKLVRSEPVPSTVFEFTTDNRVLVRSDAVEGLEYPAYVSFVDGVIVGEGAVSLQNQHPDLVVYDIHRMLSTDFDPDHPDPSWAFKTSRGGDGEVTVHMGQSSTTAIVCFGLIVSAVKKSVESATGHGLTEIGIKLPPGSAVSEDAKTSIGATIAVKLLVFN